MTGSLQTSLMNKLSYLSIFLPAETIRNITTLLVVSRRLSYFRFTTISWVSPRKRKIVECRKPVEELKAGL